MMVATACGVILIKTIKSSDLDTTEQHKVGDMDRTSLEVKEKISEAVTLSDDQDDDTTHTEEYVDSPNPLTDDDIRRLPDELRYDADTGEPLYPEIDGPEIRLSQEEINEMNESNEGDFSGPEITLSQVEIDEMNKNAAY